MKLLLKLGAPGPAGVPGPAGGPGVAGWFILTFYLIFKKFETILINLFLNRRSRCTGRSRPDR